MVEKTPHNLNVFLNQKDASSLAELELSEFDIYKFDCSRKRLVLLYGDDRFSISGMLSCQKDNSRQNSMVHLSVNK